MEKVIDIEERIPTLKKRRKKRRKKLFYHEDYLIDAGVLKEIKHICRPCLVWFCGDERI